MKIEMELNDEVAEEILTWAKQNFGDCSMKSIKDVIEELTTNMLVHYHCTPDDYNVTEAPDDYCMLFSPHFTKGG
jgi:hypothetical protein